MASKALRQFVSGTTNPKGNLGNFQHGSRLFVDNDLELAPKSKFNFHVVFSINPVAVRNMDFYFRRRNEVGMLVKSVELPKFSIATETLNQYNRKKVVQTKVDYTPVNIRFHDDNLGVTRQLWENYFSYYYADPTAAKIPGAYNRIAMANGSYIRSPYGFDNNSTIQFFDKITIYQMGKRRWTSYTLVNPMITAWNHDSLDYSSNQPGEQSMTVAYEAVSYDTGQVIAGVSPPGFGGPEHYDVTPSPISLPGGGSTAVFGQSGVLAGAEAVFGSIANGTAFNSPLGFISTAIQAVNTYQNAAALTKAGINQEITNLTNRGLAAVSAVGISGIKEAVFPVANSLSTAATTTIATIRNITGL